MVIAMLHSVVIMNMYAKSPAPFKGTSMNNITVNATSGREEYKINGFSLPLPRSGVRSIRLPITGSNTADTIFAARIRKGTANTCADVSLPVVE